MIKKKKHASYKKEDCMNRIEKDVIVSGAQGVARGHLSWWNRVQKLWRGGWTQSSDGWGRARFTITVLPGLKSLQISVLSIQSARSGNFQHSKSHWHFAEETRWPHKILLHSRLLWKTSVTNRNFPLRSLHLMTELHLHLQDHGFKWSDMVCVHGWVKDHSHPAEC